MTSSSLFELVEGEEVYCTNDNVQLKIKGPEGPITVVGTLAVTSRYVRWLPNGEAAESAACIPYQQVIMHAVAMWTPDNDEDDATSQPCVYLQLEEPLFGGIPSGDADAAADPELIPLYEARLLFASEPIVHEVYATLCRGSEENADEGSEDGDGFGFGMGGEGTIPSFPIIDHSGADGDDDGTAGTLDDVMQGKGHLFKDDDDGMRDD